MALPSVTEVYPLDPATKAEFEQLCSLLTGFLQKEHHTDGTHEDVTADTVAITRDATVKGNLRVNGGSIAMQHWQIDETALQILLRPTDPGDEGETAWIYSAKQFYVKGAFTGDPNQQYDGTIRSGAGFFERDRTVAIGAWTTPTFAAGNFTASAGAWTVIAGNVTTYVYTLIGKQMTLAFDIVATNVTVGGVLRLAIPASLVAAKEMWTTYIAKDNGGAYVPAIARVLAAGTYVELFSTAAGGNFAATAANNTEVHGQITFEVQ